MKLIRQPNLVSASSCLYKVGTKRAVKVLGAIDCNRNTPGIVLGEQPVLIEIKFTSPIDWIDATVQNERYTGTVSFKGFGYDSSDIMHYFDSALGKHTYRFKVHENGDGKLQFASKGGTGLITLWNLSGYIDNELQ